MSDRARQITRALLTLALALAGLALCALIKGFGYYAIYHWHVQSNLIFLVIPAVIIVVAWGWIIESRHQRRLRR